MHVGNPAAGQSDALHASTLYEQHLPERKLSKAFFSGDVDGGGAFGTGGSAVCYRAKVWQGSGRLKGRKR